MEQTTRQMHFLTAVKKALEGKSIEGLLALFCWDQVDEPEKQRTAQMVAGLFKPSFAPNGPRVSYSAAPIPKELVPEWFSRNGFTRGGIKYGPNLLQIGEVRLVGRNNAPSGGDFTVALGVGEKDGDMKFIGNGRVP